MLRAVNSAMRQLPCHAVRSRSIQKLTNRSIAVAAIVCLPTVLAQHSDLQVCAGLDTAEERLACFEALARRELQSTADDFATPRAAERREAQNPPVSAEEARAAIGEEHLIQDRRDAGSVSEARSAAEQAEEGITFAVSRARQDGERRWIFYMDDGQIWREIEPGTLRFPRSGEFNVVIDRGRMGDYRLRVEGKGRRTRVVRLK